METESLISQLERAKLIAENFSGEYLHHFHSPDEFINDINLSITNLKANDFRELNNIFNSFHPDSEWYDLTDKNGKEIGKNIFSITKELLSQFENKGILELIEDFIDTANEGVEILRKEFGVSDLLQGWRSGQYGQTGKLQSKGIEFFAFHGCGLAIHFRNKLVDFDFAYVPEQRNDGFDLWRLQLFANGQPKKYSQYIDKNKLEKDFNKLVEKGVIYLPEQDNSPKQYFLKKERVEDLK